MKATCLMAAVMMTGASVAAQEIAPHPPAQVQGQPAAKPAADSRRDDVRTMEMLLNQALQKGASDLARQLRLSEPNSAFVTGTGRVRGILLEGYGMFFDIDVPGMKYSVLWSAQMVELGQDRDKWLQVLASARPDDPLRKLAESQLRQTERLMAAAQGGAVLIPSPSSSPSPTTNTELASADRRVSAAVAVSEGNRLADVAALPPSAPASVALPAVAPPREIRDPNELYTESVKNALIDAMLKHSAFLRIADNEFLTIAASDSDGPQIPGQIDDASRIVIRIKGSDLSAFQAGKLTREEVLKRVEVKEF